MLLEQRKYGPSSARLSKWGILEGKLNRDTLEVCSQDGQWDILNRVHVIHPAEDQALCKTKCSATLEHSVLAEGQRLLNGHPGNPG